MPRAKRPTQDELAERYGEGGSQSLISQYLGGLIPLNLRAVLFFATQLEKSPAEIYPELAGLANVETAVTGPSSENRISEPAILAYGAPISPRAADIGREWEKLREPIRNEVAVMIHSLVAAQVREERTPPSQAKSRQNPRREDRQRPRPPS